MRRQEGYVVVGPSLFLRLYWPSNHLEPQMEPVTYPKTQTRKKVTPRNVIGGGRDTDHSLDLDSRLVNSGFGARWDTKSSVVQLVVCIRNL